MFFFRRKICNSKQINDLNDGAYLYLWKYDPRNVLRILVLPFLVSNFRRVLHGFRHRFDSNATQTISTSFSRAGLQKAHHSFPPSSLSEDCSLLGIGNRRTSTQKYFRLKSNGIRFYQIKINSTWLKCIATHYYVYYEWMSSFKLNFH